MWPILSKSSDPLHFAVYEGLSPPLFPSGSVRETRETQVRSLGQEDPLEEENGNPLSYHCLGNPMDTETW